MERETLGDKMGGKGHHGGMKGRPEAIDENVSTPELAHDKILASTGTNISQGNFNKAWGRVYGNNQYKPSWLKNGKAGFLPPPKPLFPSNKPKDPLKEETTVTAQVSKVAVTPPPSNSERRSLTPKPRKAARLPERPIYHQVSRLKINGRVLPRETELDVWRKRIELDEVDSDGRRVYNKVVKNTNVPQWLQGNNYWEGKLQRERAAGGRPLKPLLPVDRKPKPMRPIPMAKYDLTKYEHSVTRPNLVIGKEEVPRECDLHRWSKEVDIPQRVGDHVHERERDQSAGEEVTSTSGRRNWRRILNTSLPRFFTVNNYWH